MNGQTISSTRVVSSNDPSASSLSSAISRYQKGEFIAGRFCIRRQAAGSFGYVYLCYDGEHDYFYALKTPKLSQAALDEPTLFPRLQREVNLWISLGEHPHIVQCFALEVIDNLPFIIAEWVADTALLSRLYQQYHRHAPHFLDWYARLGHRGLHLRQHQANRNRISAGTSLAHWINRKRRLAPEFALQIALDICSGLMHAQAIHPGFIHRDLTPANILLTEQLRAKVTDFGLAIIAQDLLDPHHSFGTAPYMAPEQWRGEALDTRTDIYALGCILYEMLTGQPPFTSPQLERKQMREQHEHAALPALPRQLPTGINALIQSCLQKDPHARVHSFGELSEALKAIYATLAKGAPKQSVAAAPVTVEDINKIGVTYYNLGQYDQALAEFERAIGLEATYANTYTNRGCVYHVLGQYQAALADYTQAIRLGHSSINAKVCNNRGLLYLTHNAPQRALRDLNQAIALEPQYTNAYVNRGLAYAGLGQYEQALGDFDHALRLNPKHVLAHYSQSYTFDLLGRLAAAFDGYTATLKLEPTFLPAAMNRNLLYTELGHEPSVACAIQPIEKRHSPDNMTRPDRKAGFQLSQPDPQFVNLDSLEDLLSQPFVAQQLEKRRLDKMLGLTPTSLAQLPIDSIVKVKEVKYADWLHETVQRQQNLGQKITQVTVSVEVLEGDGQYQPFSAVQEWHLTIDNITMQIMAASGLQTVYDLKGRRLVLCNDHPDDLRHPLRIDNII